MVDLGFEAEGRRFEGVLGGEAEVDSEHAALGGVNEMDRKLRLYIGVVPHMQSLWGRR